MTWIKNNSSLWLLTKPNLFIYLNKICIEFLTEREWNRREKRRQMWWNMGLIKYHLKLIHHRRINPWIYCSRIDAFWTKYLIGLRVGEEAVKYWVRVLLYKWWAISAYWWIVVWKKFNRLLKSHLPSITTQLGKKSTKINGYKISTRSGRWPILALIPGNIYESNINFGSFWALLPIFS